LKKIDYIFNKADLEKRASERFKIKEVYKDGKNYNIAKDFLQKQKFIPYHNIKNLISLQKNTTYPIGYLMTDKSDIAVGYVGTWFSKRIIENIECVFCNIHTWIVEKRYRLYSYYLISSLIKEDLNLVALTPVESLKGLLLKYDFKKEKIYYKLVLNLKLFKFFKKKYEIIKEKKNIEIQLNKEYLDIYNAYSNNINKSFLIKDIKRNKKILIIGSILKKKGIEIFNIFYASDRFFFKEDWKIITNTISKEINISFFSEYILENNENIFPNQILFSKVKQKEIYIKSNKKLCSLDLLNSDLII
jgi:hypothetical protein